MSNTLKLESEASKDDSPAVIKFTFRDAEYTVPQREDWPIEALEAQEEGRMVGALKELMGSQWFTFRKTSKTAKDLEEFAEALFAAVNIDPKG